MPSTISSTVQPMALGELARRGGAAQRLGELGGRRADLHAQLLEPARHPDRPALVAEVALDLADDRRGGVRRELDAAVGVEAVDRLDQPDRADLDEVLERLAAVAEAAGAVLDQRQVQVHQRVAGGVPARRREPSSSRSSTKSSALRSRVTSTPRRAGRPARGRRRRTVIVRSMSEAGLQVAGLHGQRDRELARRRSSAAALVASVVSTCQAKLS